MVGKIPHLFHVGHARAPFQGMQTALQANHQFQIIGVINPGLKLFIQAIEYFGSFLQEDFNQLGIVITGKLLFRLLHSRHRLGLIFQLIDGIEIEFGFCVFGVFHHQLVAFKAPIQLGGFFVFTTFNLKFGLKLRA